MPPKSKTTTPESGPLADHQAEPREVASAAVRSSEGDDPHQVHREAVTLLVVYAAATGTRARAFSLTAALEILDEQAKRHDDPHAYTAVADTGADMSNASALANELRSHASAILDRIENKRCLYPPLIDSDEVPASLEHDGMLAWDAELAAELESLGEDGRGRARTVKERARERWALREQPPTSLWHLWLHGPDAWERTAADDNAFTPRAIRILTRSLWRDVVGPRLDRERRKPPALVRPVYTDALLFHSRKAVDAWDPSSRVLTFEGRELARAMGATIDLDVILRGLSLLGSLTAHRLFRWQVMTGHEQRMSDLPSANTLEVPGGWAGLARMLKMNPDKHATDLRAIVKAQAHFAFTFPNGSTGNLLTYLETPARGQKQAHLSITLGKPLMPHYAAELMGDAKRLVPLLRQLPPLYGRPNEHGQQMTMALSVVAELRERARELSEKGSVQLSHDDFTRLADRSGLPRQLIVPVRDHWLAGDDKAPAFLALRGSDRYTLADSHRAEREFIEEGGRFELQGSALGERSARAKRRKLDRIERKGSRPRPKR